MAAHPEGVLVAMSGGVDSSVAAALLVEGGWRVTGVTLRLPRYGRRERRASCCGEEAIENARAVADRLGIPHYVLNFRERFERTVVADFIRQYGAGRTPNPCVRCNEWVKFGLLLEAAEAAEAGFVATGHYARKVLREDTGRFELRTGVGPDDQSYFLFSLSQSQLARALFPLGGRTKREVRRMALERGLPVHGKRSSQDLCFLPGGRYTELLRERSPGLFRPGEIVHVSGRPLGRHSGLAAYTVGQRRGLRVAWSEPLYVVSLEPQRNRVVVGERRHVLRRAIVVGELNWIAFPHPPGPFRAHVRIRHRHRPAAALVSPLPDGRARVEFDEPQEAPAPGQAAVFYDGERVLGGGFIE